MLFSEGMLATGGYFAAVEDGFVDTGIYPETNDDGIVRRADGGLRQAP